MSECLNICVLGAGMSGLVAIKELLDEGQNVVCFERAPKEGGNFNYPVGAAYDSMHLTVSQYHMAFSCFPPPFGDKRRYWSREEYATYLHDFGVHFGLFGLIRFNMEVVTISAFAGNTQFEVTLRDTQTDTVTMSVFDAVVICSGAHSVAIPQIPQFEGSTTFSGRIEHAASYLSPEPYRDKHVVCVGFGETAADVTYQIAEVAASCWSSFRRYPTVTRRYGGSDTTDAAVSRIRSTLPRGVINRMMLRECERILSASLDESDPGDRLTSEWMVRCGTPGHQPLQKNDDFVTSVLEGKLQIKPFPIDHLDRDGVVFADGSSVKADVVMCCTGFREGTIPSDLIEGMDASKVRDLYKHFMHPDLGERIAFVGWARPVQGGIPACSEMQSRYFALLCSGKRKLPERSELRRLIAEDRNDEDAAFYARKEQETLVGYTTYMDSVAKLVDCLPHFRDFLLNPRMLYHLLCGANIPPVYRLRGPHAMPEMAQRILLRLPVAHSVRELAYLSSMHVRISLGLLRRPAAVSHLGSVDAG